MFGGQLPGWKSAGFTEISLLTRSEWIFAAAERIERDGEELLPPWLMLHYAYHGMEELVFAHLLTQMRQQNIEPGAFVLSWVAFSQVLRWPSSPQEKSHHVCWVKSRVWFCDVEIIPSCIIKDENVVVLVSEEGCSFCLAREP